MLLSWQIVKGTDLSWKCVCFVRSSLARVIYHWSSKQFTFSLGGMRMVAIFLSPWTFYIPTKVLEFLFDCLYTILHKIHNIQSLKSELLNSVSISSDRKLMKAWAMIQYDPNPNLYNIECGRGIFRLWIELTHSLVCCDPDGQLPEMGMESDPGNPLMDLDLLDWFNISREL